MKIGDDFESGYMLVGLAVIVIVGLCMVGAITYALWVAVHPLVVVIMYLPLVGGLANVAIQWARRKWRRE